MITVGPFFANYKFCDIREILYLVHVNLVVDSACEVRDCKMYSQWKKSALRYAVFPNMLSAL